MYVITIVLIHPRYTEKWEDLDGEKAKKHRKKGNEKYQVNRSFAMVVKMRDQKKSKRVRKAVRNATVCRREESSNSDYV